MQESIGQQLKTAREGKNLTIEQVAEELHIRKAYLIALEENRIEAHLPAVQAKGFLRLYADFLDVVLFTEIPSIQPDSDLMATNEVPESPDSTVVDTESPSFGEQFSLMRVDKKLSFQDVEGELHISQGYLKAIEEEDFQALPQGIQARGMIQRYAEFLELETEPILEQYADILYHTQPAMVSDTIKRKQARKVDGAKQIITPDLIIGVSLLAVIFVIAFLGIRKVISTRSVFATPETTDVAFVATETLTPNPQSSPTTDELQGTAVPGAISTATLQIRPTSIGAENQSSRIIVQIIANQRAFLRITSDGDVVFDGRVVGGNIYYFYGEQKIELLTGNAAALDITVIQDGKETNLGILGLVGQVVSLTFQPDMIITPTVTPSLTPTITNTPLPTATPTITLIPTSTEAP